jgi:DNA-binding SARP family transcriptional activator
VVAAPTLVEVIWDGRAPRSAASSMRNYVMRLRGVLGRAGERISSRSGGYLIEVDEDELDCLRFARLLENGSAAFRDGAFERAATLLGEALALWRGPALADVPSDTLLRDELPRLAESRLDALELKLDAESRLGRHGLVIAELKALTALHPEREQLWVQLMTALYRHGRQSEALATYQRIRRILAEDIGVEPGAQLRAVHQQILTADPALDAWHGGARRTAAETARPAPAGPASRGQDIDIEWHSAADGRTGRGSGRHGVSRVLRGVGPVAGLFQVPADTTDFTGRRREVRDLVARLTAKDRAAAVRTVVTGQAGIGKSALAIHVAHKARKAFPDGILYADLHGADGAAVAPVDVLVSFLGALGVAAEAIPAGLAGRSALLRSVLADRRVLMVLDDAVNLAHISPLLPSTASCATLITSRTRLTDLAGAHHVELDVLTADEAARLFARVAGAARAEIEPKAVAQVVRACGRLPLALRIAAARLAARPLSSAAQLAERLADGSRLLDELKIGSLDVRASLRRSYDALDPATARAFRLLALCDAPSVNVEVADAMLGLHGGRAERLLEDLVDARLMAAVRSGGYAFPDLIRRFALEQAFAQESETDRACAVRRAAQVRAIRRLRLPSASNHDDAATAQQPLHASIPAKPDRRLCLALPQMTGP